MSSQDLQSSTAFAQVFPVLVPCSFLLCSITQGLLLPCAVPDAQNTVPLDLNMASSPVKLLLRKALWLLY